MTINKKAERARTALRDLGRVSQGEAETVSSRRTRSIGALTVAVTEIAKEFPSSDLGDDRELSVSSVDEELAA